MWVYYYLKESDVGKQQVFVNQPVEFEVNPQHKSLQQSIVFASHLHSLDLCAAQTIKRTELIKQQVA